MKKTKLFAMMSIILAMGLAACGGSKSSQEPAKSSSEPAPSSQVQPSSEPSTPSTSAPTPSTSAPTPSSSSSARPSSSTQPSSSAQPSSSTQPSSSSVAPDSSSSQPASSSEVPPEPVAAVNVSSVTIAKKENNIFLQISGTVENIAAADFLWALGLEHTGAASGGDSKEGFILGAAEFAAENYVLPATISNDGTFLFEYDLTGLETFVAGSYFITAAVKDYGPVTIGNTKPDIELLDANYRFYFRNDISNKLTICADELPPLALTEASIIKEDGKIWAKIGGEVSSAAITQEVLDGYDTFIQFQSVGNGWGNTKKSKEDGGYHWKLEGTKAFLYADVTFFQVGYNYNTHLNAKSNTQANCKMEVNIDEHYNIEKEDGVWVDYEVFSDLTASGSDQSKFWGNLGFRVTAGKDPSVHYHEMETVETKQNSQGKDVKLEKCTANDFNRIVLGATEGKLNGQEDGKAGKLKKTASYEFEVNITTAADLTVELVIGRSDSHYERHMFNEAKWNEANPDNQVTLPSQSPDKTTEDDWRYTVEVSNDGGNTYTPFAITNMQTPKEANNGVNPSGTFYYSFVNNLVLKNGTNLIRITRNNIGYASVFAGELRLEFATGTVALADAPAA